MRLRGSIFAAIAASASLWTAPALADANQFASANIVQILHLQTVGLVASSSRLSWTQPCTQGGIDAAQDIYGDDVQSGDALSGHTHAAAFASGFASCALSAQTRQQFFIFAGMALVEMTNLIYSDHASREWTGLDVAKAQQAHDLGTWIIKNSGSPNDRRVAAETLQALSKLNPGAAISSPGVATSAPLGEYDRPSIATALNGCVYDGHAGGTYTVLEITYDQPLVSVRYAAGKADEHTLYFLQTTPGTYKCLDEIPSRNISGVTATTSALQHELKQNGVSFPTSRIDAFVQDQRGHIYRVNITRVTIPSP